MPSSVCAICQDKLVRPVVLDVCGHLFCLSCIEKARKYKVWCPLCHQAFAPHSWREVELKLYQYRNEFDTIICAEGVGRTRSYWVQWRDGTITHEKKNDVPRLVRMRFEWRLTKEYRLPKLRRRRRICVSARWFNEHK